MVVAVHYILLLSVVTQTKRGTLINLKILTAATLHAAVAKCQQNYVKLLQILVCWVVQNDLLGNFYTRVQILFVYITKIAEYCCLVLT